MYKIDEVVYNGVTNFIDYAYILKDEIYYQATPKVEISTESELMNLITNNQDIDIVPL